MKRHPLLTYATGLLLTLACAAPAAQPLTNQPAVARFVAEMSSKYGFDKHRLSHLLDQAQISQDVLDAVSRPAENKPWYEYRPIFMTQPRIDNGVKFMGEYHSALHRAESRYGVPPEVITAILGVETFYGQHVGTHRVIDTLVTLAFDYPARSDFFRSELENYLLLTREQDLDPLVIKGSYAGAMGLPQFISSSYRSYAVDFDGDGKKDLWSDAADAIGSVANYLNAHGWKNGRDIAVHARVTGDAYRKMLDKGLQPSLRVSQLKHYGIETDKPLPGDPQGALVQLETENGYDYWLGMENFYVITRYNHSPLYAMAVYQLSQQIKAGRERALAASRSLSE